MLFFRTYYSAIHKYVTEQHPRLTRSGAAARVGQRGPATRSLTGVPSQPASRLSQ